MAKTHKDVADFYDHVYYANATGNPARLNAHLKRLAATLTPAPSAQALDIACGAGGWLQLLANRGYRPSGIDISAKAIDICRQIMPEGAIKPLHISSKPEITPAICPCTPLSLIPSPPFGQQVSR